MAEVTVEQASDVVWAALHMLEPRFRLDITESGRFPMLAATMAKGARLITVLFQEPKPAARISLGWDMMIRGVPFVSSIEVLEDWRDKSVKWFADQTRAKLTVALENLEKLLAEEGVLA